MRDSPGRFGSRSRSLSPSGSRSPSRRSPSRSRSPASPGADHRAANEHPTTNSKLKSREVHKERRNDDLGPYDDRDPRECRIVATNVTYSATPAHLEEIFGAYGSLKTPIVRAPQSKLVFLEYETREACQAAIDALHGAVLDGATIKVGFARLPHPLAVQQVRGKQRETSTPCSRRVRGVTSRPPDYCTFRIRGVT